MMQKINSKQRSLTSHAFKWCYVLLVARLKYYYQSRNHSGLRRSLSRTYGIRYSATHPGRFNFIDSYNRPANGGEVSLVVHCKSKLHNYHNLSRFFGISFGSLFITLGEYLFYQPLRKVRAVFGWPSLWGKVGMGPFLFLILISSCKVGKEYQRPELELPAQFNTVSFSDTSSIADIEWKNFFTDATLQNLIEKGINYNHDLLTAIKNIDIAHQQVKQAKVLQLPEVDLNIAGQISRPADNSFDGQNIKTALGRRYIEDYSAGFNFSWEADIWGKLRGQKEIALTQYLGTTEAAKAVQTQLVADIAQGFFNLLMLDQQLEITRRNLAVSDTFVTATRLLRDAGLANTLAVQQAESQKLATALLIPQLQQSIAIQENALQLLTGQLPGRVSRSVSINEFAVAKDLSTGLPAAMVSRRPDVRSDELALQAANTQVGISQADMYPALNITAGGGLESFKANNWFSIPNSLFGLAGATIAQPIFRRRELKTQFEIDKLEREQAVIKFRQTVLTATIEVANALVDLQKLDQQQQIATDQVDTLRNAVTNALLLFKSDLADYLEVLTAQGDALQAELDLATIRRAQLSAMVELYRSLGGGWK